MARRKPAAGRARTRLTVDLEPGVHRRLKSYARRQRTTMRALLLSAVGLILKRARKRQ